MKSKMFKIWKRSFSVFAVTALFLLTALGATVNAQNANTYSPIPYAYSQPSARATPYVATSNGLTYTVEPNGTYLWNGHYLRAPPVPYPKVPKLANDGLPFGAINPGAEGQQGAISFTKGTPTVIGDWWNNTTNKVTYINKTTFWGNETITLHGNVSINAPLTIYNTAITWDTPAAYPYFFNNSGSAGTLTIRHGSLIGQTNKDNASWFMMKPSGYPNSAYFHITNSTLIWNSTHVIAPAGTTIANSIFLPLQGDINYSTIIGNWYLMANYIAQKQPFGYSGIYNYGFQSHDLFNNFTTQLGPVYSNNDTFMNCSLIFSLESFSYVIPHYVNSYYTVKGENSSMNVNPMSHNVTISNILFEDSNMSRFSSGGPGASNPTVNVTYENISMINDWFRPPLNYGGDAYYLGGTETINPGAQKNISNIFWKHITLQNITNYGVNNYGEYGSGYNWTLEYSLIKNFILDVPVGGSSSEDTFNPVGQHQIIYNNLWQNMLNIGPGGDGLTVSSEGFMFLGTHLVSGVSSNTRIYDNFVINGSGSGFVFAMEQNMVVSGAHQYVYNNTFINLSGSMQGIGDGNGPTTNLAVYNDSFYGIYSGAFAIMSDPGFSLTNFSIYSNHYYDVDTNQDSIVFGTATGSISNENLPFLNISYDNISQRNSLTTFKGMDKLALNNSTLQSFILTRGVSSTPYANGYNITTYDSYVPAALLETAYNWSLPSYPANVKNPSFLNAETNHDYDAKYYHYW